MSNCLTILRGKLKPGKWEIAGLWFGYPKQARFIAESARFGGAVMQAPSL